MSSGNPIKDYKKLSKALTGQTEPRESKIERQNRENRERNLQANEEAVRRRRAANLADKLGEKAGIPKGMRDAVTKPYRK
jgi:hypothetical protein